MDDLVDGINMLRTRVYYELSHLYIGFSGICLGNSSGVLRKFIIYIVIGLSLFSLSLFTLSITFVRTPIPICPLVNESGLRSNIASHPYQRVSCHTFQI